jgi:hypothetical protein
VLLVVVAPTEVAWVFRALAADTVASAADPEAQAVRRAYAIEALAADQKRPALEAALASDTLLLRGYALAAIEDRGVLGREGGAEAIAAALGSPHLTWDDKIDLGARLTRRAFFDRERDADRANQLAVAALVKALLADPDADERLQWIRILGSALLPEFAPAPAADHARRSALLRASGAPLGQVIHALAGLTGHVSGDDEETVRDLLAAFRAAAAGH